MKRLLVFYFIFLCFHLQAQKKRLFYALDSLEKDIYYLEQNRTHPIATNMSEVIQDLDSLDKKNLFDLSKKIYYSANNYRAPIENFYFIISNSKNTYPHFLSHFFTILRNMFLEYDGKQRIHFLESLKNFIQSQKLYSYSHNHNVVEVDSTDYRLGYIPKENNEKKEGKKPSTKPIAIEVENSASFFDKGPILKLGKTDYYYKNSKDTVQIFDTEGFFFFNQNIYVGTQGIFYWDRVGLDSAEVYTQLGNFTFEVLKQKIESQQAKLTHKKLNIHEIPGFFSYESKKNKKQPVFIASDPVSLFLSDSLNYFGSFSLSGKKISNSSLPNSPHFSDLSFQIGDKPIYKVHSEDILQIEDTVLRLQNAELSIYHHENDSIYHPKIQLRYDLKNHLLTARKSKSGYKNHPFISSFHKVNIFTDYLIWNIGKDSLHFTILNARNKVPLKIESVHFFNPIRYSLLQGINTFHPLQMVYHYAVKNKLRRYKIQDLAEQIKINPQTLVGGITSLEELGYILYHPLTDEIETTALGEFYYFSHLRQQGKINNLVKNIPSKQKMANDTIQDGHKEKKYNIKKLLRFDYDTFYFNSRTDSIQNSTLYLKDSVLKVYGVDRVYLSDALNISLIPSNGEVVIKEDRGMEFSGKILTDKFTIYSKKLLFDYNNFTVGMYDSTSIVFLAEDSTSVKREVVNTISNTSGGYLDILQYYNKSALLNYDAYPKLSLEEGGKIEFENEKILDGVYDNQISFNLSALKVDGVNKKSVDEIGVKGLFQTKGIFPDLAQTVKVMPDHSLGFEVEEEKNYPIYQKKAHYLGVLKFDKKGLQGKGLVTYLGNDFYSNKFVFYPDSLSGIGNKLNMEQKSIKGVDFPQVHSLSYKMKWYTSKDSMLLSSLEKSFDIFGETYKLQGDLILTPKGLYGQGVFFTNKSKNISKSFTFNSNSYKSEGSDYYIYKNSTQEKPSILSKNTEVSYNVATKDVKILADNTKNINFILREVNYATSLDYISWNEDEDRIIMGLQDGKSPQEAFCVSLNKKDPIQFNLKKIIYSLKERKMSVEEVSELIIANSIIIPDENKLVVNERGKIEELKNATLILNKDNGYHTFYHANLNIISHKEFAGEAQYKYINNKLDTFSIVFHDFDISYPNQLKDKKKKRDTDSIQIKANSTINKNQDFYIIDGFHYSGEIVIDDRSKTLQFDGKIRLNINRDDLTWFEYTFDYENEGEKLSSIYLDENFKEAGSRNNTHQIGLYLSRKMRSFYPMFVEYDKDKIHDIQLFPLKGELSFDYNKRKYIIKQKTSDDTSPENEMKYDIDNGKFQFKGVMNLLPIDTESYQLSLSGQGGIDYDGSLFYYDCIFYLQLLKIRSLTDYISTIFSDENEEYTEFETNPLHTNKELTEKVKYILPKKSFNNFINTIEEEEPVYTSDYFKEGVFLHNVWFKWSNDFSAFYNTGKGILSNLFNKDYGKEVSAYIELPKEKDNNTLHLFLIDEEKEKWLYLKIKKETIFIYSSSPTFNKILQSKRLNNTSIATKEEIHGFVDRFRIDYLNESKILHFTIPEIEKQEKEDVLLTEETKPKKEELEEEDGF